MASGGRILISLNAAITPAVLERALASLWPLDADEIVGLFIEDTEILSLGRLPVAREIRYDDATPRPPDVARLERQLRAQASRIRAAFEERAGKLGRKHSFQITRGPGALALREACAGFDVLLVTSPRERLEYRWALRAQLPALLAGGPRMLIVVQEAPRDEPRIAVLFDDSPASRTALATAAEIAHRRSLGLSVLVPAEPPADRTDLMRQVEATIGPWPNARFHFLGNDGAQAIADAATRDAVRVLLIPREDDDNRRRLIVDVLERVDCSVIVTG